MQFGSQFGATRGTPDMRIAVTIVAGGLSLVIAIQSSTAQVGDDLLDGDRLQAAGAAAWFIALLYLLGAGFAYGVPALAGTMFGLAGVISLTIASDSGADVFGFWGAAALVLAAMCAIGWREKRRIFRRRLVHRVIDEQLVPIDSVRPPRSVDPRT